MVHSKRPNVHAASPGARPLSCPRPLAPLPTSLQHLHTHHCPADIVEIKHIMLPPSAHGYKDIYVVFELLETDLHQVIKVCWCLCAGARVNGGAGHRFGARARTHTHTHTHTHAHTHTRTHTRTHTHAHAHTHTHTHTCNCTHANTRNTCAGQR